MHTPVCGSASISLVPLLSSFLVSNASALAGAAEVSHQKAPSWLDVSLGVKEGYDDNVFLSGVDSRFLPATIPVPDGSVAALPERSSWVTTVSPKLGLNLLPLFGDGSVLQTASLAYAPDFAVYHNQDSESFNAHRFSAAIQGKADAWSLAADQTFIYVDGSQYGPTYPGSLLNAYATATARERREQIQNRTTINIRRDWERSFVRATAAGAFFELMTEKINTAGYQNYVDRFDVNGGLDFGFKATPKLALTLGYRYGHQYQQQLEFAPYSSSSDYHRVLVGIEGKPWSWLDLKIQAGPDFRDYEANTATHITPVNDLQPVCYFAEASATATLSTRDTITFKLKQWQWVSSTGRIPYFDTAMELSYRRKWTEKLEFDLSGRYVASDYTGGNIPASDRHDQEFTAGLGAKYNFNKHVSATAAWSHQLGSNALDNVADEETRAYARSLFSFGLNFKL